MGEWNRSTKELPLEGIRPEMRATLQEHIESYNLGAVLDGYLICIETTSEKKKKGLFGGGGDKIITAVYIVTPHWLFMCAQGDKSGASALSVQLKDVVVTDYADSPGYKLLPDNGLEVTGKFTGRVGMNGNERIMTFLPLGKEPVSKKFKEVLFQSIQNAKK